MITLLLNRLRNPYWPKAAEPIKTHLRKIRFNIMLSIIRKALAQIQTGQLILTFEGHSYRFGHTTGDSKPLVIQIHHHRALRCLLSHGSLGAAEGYIQGYWTTDDLTAVCRLFLQNPQALNTLSNRLSKSTQIWLKWQHTRNRNTHSGSKRNIAAHYDLSNPLFETFLDTRMMYSCGVYRNPTDTLEQASEQKLARICEWLQLDHNDHLLEIGTGWGGFAIYAAQTTGCRVTTTTISSAQYAYTRDQVIQLGLTHQIEVLCQDYRQLTGQYDKLVSIEMIEAVGQDFLSTYFETCNARLKHNGLMFLQVITIQAARAAYYQRHVDFIQTYIFPGGHLPALNELEQLISDHTQLQLTKTVDIGYDYALTLNAWRSRFERNRTTIQALAFDDTFIRLWRYYLCYCEAGFLAGHIHCQQMLLAASHNTQVSSHANV